MTEQTNQNSPMPLMTVDSKDLPSRGVGYPEGLKIYYRSYTFGEVKKVSASNEIDLQQIIEATMAGIEIKEENFNKQDMSFVDLLYIGLLRRVSSQGTLKYQMPYKCEKCKQVTTAIFTSNDIDFQEIDPAVESLPLAVTLGGEEFHFTYPTVKNMLAVKNSKAGKRKGLPAMEITAGNVVNMKFEDALRKLKNITDEEEMLLLEEVDKMIFHGIKEIETTCTMKVKDEDDKETTCNQVNHVNIEGKEMLIRPFRDGEGTNRAKIRFVSK